MVVGAIALLLQRQPGMTPSQIKQLLLTSTSHTYPGQPDAAGMLDVAKAMLGASNPPNQVQAAATDLAASLRQLARSP